MATAAVEYAEQNHPTVKRVKAFVGRVNDKNADVGGLYLHAENGYYGECWLCLRAPAWQGWLTAFGAEREAVRLMIDHQRNWHGGVR